MIYGFLALYAAAGFGLVAFLVLDYRKRRFVATPGAALILLSAGQPLNGLGNYAIGMVGVGLGVTALLLAPRPGREGTVPAGKGNGFLGLFVFIPLVVVAWTLTSFWFARQSTILSQTIEVPLTNDEPVVSLLLTASGDSLPSGTQISDVSASSNQTVHVEHLTGFPLECPQCIASARVSVMKSDPGTHPVLLGVRVEGPRHRVRYLEDDDVTIELDFASTGDFVARSYEATVALDASRVFEVVRLAIDAPATTMVSPSLNEWPAFLALDPMEVDALGGQNPFRFARLYCQVGEDCRYRQAEVVQFSRPRPEEYRINASAYFFDGTDPEIDITLDKPLSWQIDTWEGTIEFDEATGQIAFDLPVEDLPPDAVLVAVDIGSANGGTGLSQATLADCSMDRCSFSIETAWSSAIQWQLELHWGFWSQTPQTINWSDRDPVAKGRPY